MIQNAAIDVAIGLILMYLMLSLLCTVVNEFIATKLKLRACTLQDALQKLIDDPDLLREFYAHGMIASSTRTGATGSQSILQAVANAPSAVRNLIASSATPPATSSSTSAHPSYLAGGTVALAIMGVLLKQQKAPGTADFTAVQTAINNLTVAPTLKDALQASLLQANGDINILRQSIANWFDDSMDRLSGAYKRRMKWIAMLIGLFVAIAFNADSFNVATTLWSDADRRASAIAIATQIAQKPPSTSEQPVDRGKLGDEIKNTESTLRSLPIGWNCPADTAGGSIWACVLQKPAPVHVLGWLLTAAALSLGAPFWFDLLNKFINLRGAGEKPKREDEK